MLPLVYCDFDGVLNVFPDEKMMRRGGPKHMEWMESDDPRRTLYDPNRIFLADMKSRVKPDHRSYGLRWSSELAGMLDKLMWDGRIEFHWLSTWQPHTVLLDRRLGFDHALTHTEHWYDPVTREGIWTGKRHTVYGAVERQRGTDDPAPIVWIDDDEVFARIKTEVEGLLPAAPVLLVRPHPAIGVSRRQWVLIQRFIADPSAFSLVTFDQEPDVGGLGEHLGFW